MSEVNVCHGWRLCGRPDQFYKLHFPLLYSYARQDHSYPTPRLYSCNVITYTQFFLLLRDRKVPCYCVSLDYGVSPVYAVSLCYSVSLFKLYVHIMVLASVMLLAPIMVFSPCYVVSPYNGVSLCYDGSNDLNAQRAQKTKSRGPKGFKLEVGPLWIFLKGY